MAFRTLKKLALSLAERAGLANLVQRVSRVPDQLYVLAYHRVDEVQRAQFLDPSLINATPSQFEQQMALIARRYHPVLADEVLDAIERRRLLPRDAVLVTVDDGYRDFKDVIFPITQRYGIRPILFVATGYVGQGIFWWDQLFRAVHFSQKPEIVTPLGALPVRTLDEKKNALDRLRAHIKQIPFEQARRQVETLYAETVPELSRQNHATLDWNELRELTRAGVTIAAHTHTHPILSHIPLNQAREEIRQSQSIIAREIGHAKPFFAFPDGKPQAFNDDLIPLLQSEGFKLAFTMIEGCARIGHDNLLCLPRLGVSSKSNLGQFHMHLTPVYDRWKRSKNY